MNIPWQFQVNTDNIAVETGSDPEKQVLNLQAALEEETEKTTAARTEIEPQLLAAKNERREANANNSLMLSNVELVKDMHTALAPTVEEKRITSYDTNKGIRLTSCFSVPTSPIGPRKSLYAASSAVGVVFLAVLFIVLITWWRSP